MRLQIRKLSTMAITTVCVDTNVIVALANTYDKWHDRSVAIRNALLAAEVQLVYFDCVINEAIGVIGRRAEEQGRSDQFGRLMDYLLAFVPESSLTWITGSAQRLFPTIIELCRLHQGKLNFHDALMSLACQELGINTIVSFDGDFDALGWLQRISHASQIENSPPL